MNPKSSVTLQSYKIEHMDIRRRLVFYYMMFASSQNKDGTPSSSGIAEFNGNDSLITLGRWKLNSNSATNRNNLVNTQAATLMHEFGHNLGLKHGGNEVLNFKPNYHSTMNYMYQLNGLSTLGVIEGDRYYHSNYSEELANTHCRDTPQSYPTTPRGLHLGPFASPEDFKIDYSNGLGQPLDESNLDETKGLGHPVTDGVDFNCDGDTKDTGLSLDITNADSEQQKTILNDFNDWEAISLKFRNTPNGSTRAPSTPHHVVENSKQDFLLNDRQTVIVEDTPSRAFFDYLRKQEMIN
ncbi:hypothetical protein HC752_12315 [Vibrio sp. S9_S30]|uniref:hypothetical protein n=1 Tax=Vibrio sp. S9_S30 TaxID=2720226 RepID=UPI00168050F0|nr:hypothetical protein [Vibrio sp. S9_S30]MBD1557717.1 hypothetical protein [Vibrio sp. S9_S30]